MLRSLPREAEGADVVRAKALPAILSTSAVLLAGIAVTAWVELEPLSFHMVQHIALMNVIAPLAAVAITRAANFSFVSSGTLWTAALIQILLLCAWHVPSVQQTMLHSGLHQIAMHGSLFAAAVLFWTSLLRLPAHAPWQGIAALLLTGKLACLIASLLIFAPRLLYAAGSSEHHAAQVTLSDQQLAGLLMITACPLSYVVAGLVMAAQALSDLHDRADVARSKAVSIR